MSFPYLPVSHELIHITKNTCFNRIDYVLRSTNFFNNYLILCECNDSPVLMNNYVLNVIMNNIFISVMTSMSGVLFPVGAYRFNSTIKNTRPK